MSGDPERESGLQAALLDNIPGCLALIIKNGTREIVASNRLARERGAVAGDTCYGACMSRAGVCPFCLAPELWATGDPQQIEAENEGKWYEAIWAPFSDDAYVHYIFDITHRKRAEEQLAKSERHFRSLIEHAADAIYVVTRDGGRILACNERACGDTGYTREELLGMCASDLEVDLTAHDIEALHESLSPGAPLTTEGAHRRKDGSTFPVEVRFALMEEGEPQLILSIIRDITERKQDENALQTAKDYAERLIQTANAMILGLDIEGRVILVNDATVAATGYSRDELLGKNWSMVLPEEQSPETWEVFHRLVSGETERRHENPIITKSGELRHIIWQNNVVRERGEIVSTISFGIDITDRKRAEEALRQSEEQLRQSQKMEAVGQLAGGIAHDFNNLLTAIIGYSDLLLADEAMQSPSPREDLQEIKHAAERAAALTRQILAFSRRQALRPELVSLNETLGGMEQLLRRTLGEDIELVTMLQPDLGLTEVDVNQFEQVLMNLAVNARDAMPYGGRLTLRTANAVLSKRYCRLHPGVEPGPFVMLSVADTGVGMDDETVSHIFEPFFTTKGPGEGTGLGLSTAYGIVRQSGGTIEVRSEVGRGTTFKVYLPLPASPFTPDALAFKVGEVLARPTEANATRTGERTSG